MVREQFQSEQATAQEPWPLRPLAPSDNTATGDDSPSMSAILSPVGFAEADRMADPRGEGRPARRPVRRSALAQVEALA